MNAREQTYSEQGACTKSRLWRFATQAYALPTVARSCLQAQEAWGVDVNLTLYVCWCAREARRVEAADISLAQDQCQPWRDQVILPLRAQRMAWRGQPQYAAQYTALKALELEAERVQLDFLAGLFDQSADSHPRASSVSYTALLAEHLALLACHYGLDQDAFEDLWRALTVAQVRS